MEGDRFGRDRPSESTHNEWNKDWVELDDVHIVAYLHCRGLEFKTIKQEGGRVMFMINGDNVDQLIREFHGGHEINVNQYVSSLKYVKGRLYGLKYRGGE